MLKPFLFCRNVAQTREMIYLEYLYLFRLARKNSGVHLSPWIQQLRALKIGKRLYLFYNSRCLLALKNKQKSLVESVPVQVPQKYFYMSSLYISSLWQRHGTFLQNKKVCGCYSLCFQY